MFSQIIISIISMLGTLAIAYGIDQWITYQQRLARQDLTFPQAYLWVIIGGLLLLTVWLALGWFTLVKSRRILAISLIYLVVGLLSFAWFPLEMVSRFWATHLFLFSNLVNNFQYSGLYIALLGLLTLLFPKRTTE